MRLRGCNFDTPHRKLMYKASPFMNESLTLGVISLDNYRTIPIFDQGQTSSCEGHRAAMGLHIAFAAMGTPLTFIPSPKGIYTDARCWDRGDPRAILQDNGTQTSSVIMALQSCGIAGLQTMAPDGRNSDCDPSTINEDPTLTELIKESAFKVEEAHTISEDASQYQQALKAGFPIQLDVFVESNWDNWDGSQPLNNCNRSDPSGGGHAILCTSMTVNPDGSCIYSGPNSWGTGWGKQGYWVATQNWLNQALEGASIVQCRKL